MREGSQNPNWKGGLTKFRTADEILGMSAQVKETVRQRLKRYRVDPVTGCWNWTGKRFKSNGRALLYLGSNFLAYRLAYVLAKGPTGGLLVMHTCDNVLCVNPKHLKLGTNADNSADMTGKGRAAVGDRNGSRLYPERLVRGDAHPNRIHPERTQAEKNGRAQLTNEQVREIRRRYIPYTNNHKPSNRRELAAEFGVSVNIISLIAKGQTWRSVR